MVLLTPPAQLGRGALGRPCHPERGPIGCARSRILRQGERDTVALRVVFEDLRRGDCTIRGTWHCRFGVDGRPRTRASLPSRNSTAIRRAQKCLPSTTFFMGDRWLNVKSAVLPSGSELQRCECCGAFEPFGVRYPRGIVSLFRRRKGFVVEVASKLERII